MGDKRKATRVRIRAGDLLRRSRLIFSTNPLISKLKSGPCKYFLLQILGEAQLKNLEYPRNGDAKHNHCDKHNPRRTYLPTLNQVDDGLNPQWKG